MDLVTAYFRLAFRMLRIDRYASLTNILGICVGISVLIFLIMFVDDELSYEEWVPNSKLIYRVSGITNYGLRTGVVPSDVAQWIKQDFHQIDEVVRLFNSSETVSRVDRFKSLEKITWVDYSFFNVFEIEAIQGSTLEALSEPYQVVLTESIAKKYFGDDAAVGKTLEFRNTYPMSVTAVIPDLPHNTHLSYSILASGVSPISPTEFHDRSPIVDSFGSKAWAASTYAKLNKENSVYEITEALPYLLDRRIPSGGETPTSEEYGIEFMGIQNIHLEHSNVEEGVRDLSDIYLLITIALVILIAVSCNYISITIAQARKRQAATEVRRIYGASNASIFLQFSIESALQVFVGFVLAVIVVLDLLTPLNSMLGKSLSLDQMSGGVILSLIGGTILFMFLGAIYPVISFYSGALTRTPRINKNPKAFDVGAMLCVAQCSILIVLIISTYVVYGQAQFAVREAKGAITDPIVLITSGCPKGFVDEVEALIAVKTVSCSTTIPQYGLRYDTAVSNKRADLRIDRVSYMSVDSEFFDLFDYNLLAGRFFNEGRIGDYSPEDNQWIVPEPIIINSTAARYLGFEVSEEAIGEFVEWSHIFRAPNIQTGIHRAEIVGVVEDFPIGSVREGTMAAAFYFSPSQFNITSVRLSSDFTADTLNQIDEIWYKYVESSIQRTFFTESIGRIYRDISINAQILGIFSSVAALLLIFGLIGLVSNIVHLEAKGTCIRKIVGASKLDIAVRLYVRVLRPVFWANIIAWPIAYYYLDSWLEQYSRNVGINWWVFPLSGVVVITTAALTISVHTIILSNKEPSEILRRE